MKIDFGLFHTYQQACFQMRLLIESSLSYFFHDVHFALTNIMYIRKSTYKQAISFQSGTTCKKKGCHPHGELCSIYVHQAWSMYIAKNGHPLKWQILIKLILYKFEILRFLPDQHDLNSKSLINSSNVNAFEQVFKCQLISKCIFGVFNSSKKRTKKST